MEYIILLFTERGELFRQWFVLDVKFRIILLILAEI